MEKQPLLNTYVNNVDWEEVLEIIGRMAAGDKPSYIVEVNVDVLVKMERDPYLRRIAGEADLTLVDGTPLLWIARWQKRPVKAKISGSDLVLALCREAARTGRSLFILGGAGETPALAAARCARRFPGLKIAGYYAPPWGFERNEKERERINQMIRQADPDILFACFGCPKQEKWVYENYKACGARVCLCAGASVDFLAGRIKRAPAWMSRAGLEWFYRFLREPGRLFKRYFIDDMQILWLMWKTLR